MNDAASLLAQDSLAYAMLHAARVCVAVRAGRSLTESLAEVRASLPAGARGAIQDLAFRTMRARGAADAVLAEFATRMPPQALVRELLCIALALLDGVRCDGAACTSPPYPPFTVVDQAVTAIASQRDTVAARGFVNAVLRSVLRQSERVSAVLSANEAARLNYPVWWIARLRRAYPEQWQAILAAGQCAAPLTLRVNRRRSSLADYLALLEEAGLAARTLGESAVCLERARPVDEIPGFAAGLVSVQDEAAQRAAALLDAHSGQRVLDACAAPGGKAAHLLELADLDLTALDVSALRLRRVADNFARLGLLARLVEGDAGEPAGWWDGRHFDRILADLPCTASGIVRRHPDVRWLRRETDIKALSSRQQQILDALWSVLAPGGKLLIVTCSVFPEEGTLLARDFARRHGDAASAADVGQLLPEAMPDADHDGLFFALFDKTA